MRGNIASRNGYNGCCLANLCNRVIKDKSHNGACRYGKNE